MQTEILKNRGAPELFGWGKWPLQRLFQLWGTTSFSLPITSVSWHREMVGDSNCISRTADEVILLLVTCQCYFGFGIDISTSRLCNGWKGWFVQQQDEHLDSDASWTICWVLSGLHNNMTCTVSGWHISWVCPSELCISKAPICSHYHCAALTSFVKDGKSCSNDFNT